MDKDINYRAKAVEDAADTVREYKDEIVRQLVEDGKASNDLNNDYPSGDAYHHEAHVDRGYTLLEAAHVLDELSEFEADDSGLWEGQAPREAVETMAAFTYGNAVYSLWNELIERINEIYQELQEDAPTASRRQSWTPRRKGGSLTIQEIAKKAVEQALAEQ